MIKIDSLEKTYSFKKGKKVKALKGVSFELFDAGLVFIAGENGSGKSALLSLLGGLDRPTGGEIVIDGVSSRDFGERDLDAYRNEYAGLVFQDPDLLERYSAGANVELALELQGKRAQREQVEALFRALELADDGGNTFYERRIQELSDGQKQRVALARALIKGPELLLADEPAGALDREEGEALYALLKKISADKLIVVATRDRERAERYGDRIIELKEGSVVSDRAVTAAHSGGESKRGRLFFPRMPGKLPFVRALSMSLAALRDKKVQLIVCVLFAVLSLSSFGFSLVCATADPVTAELKMAYDAGVKTVILAGNSTRVHRHVYDGGRLPTSVYVGEDTQYLVPEQIEILEDYSAIMPLLPESTDNKIDGQGYFAISDEDLSFAEKYNPYNFLGRYPPISRVIELDPVTGASDAALTPDPRLTVECRLPRTFDEIALTDFQADMFIRFGYKDADGDGRTYAIEDPDDLIGKTIHGLTICGVYATGEDKEWFKRMYDFDNEGDFPEPNKYSSYVFFEDIDNFVYTWMQGVHPMKYAFVCEGFYEHSEGREYYLYEVLYKLSGDISKDKEIFARLSYKRDQVSPGPGQTNIDTICYAAKPKTAYSGFSEATASVRDRYVIRLWASISLAAAFIGALLLMNYLRLGANARKRETSILRMLGVRRRDIGLICVVEGLAIALIVFVLSLLAIGVACIIVNMKFYLWMYVLGTIPIFAVLAVSIAVGALASAIAAILVTRKKPIAIVGGRN